MLVELMEGTLATLLVPRYVKHLRFQVCEANEEAEAVAAGAEVDYKIGDLGHVAHILADNISPEEGDCRYMAPEFLGSLSTVMDPHQLFKADIFRTFDASIVVIELTATPLTARSSVPSLRATARLGS